LLFLQYAQEFALQMQGDFTHFIQKQGSAIGQFKASRAFTGGPRESSFGMPEKLAFEQIRRNGGTIDTNKRAPAALTLLVNRTGYQLLAGARFSADQNRRIGRRNQRKLLNQMFDSRAFTKMR
jgi:hypothetical protein